MIRYLAPLGVFVSGNLALLVVFLFLSNIGAAGDQLATDTAAMAPTFWNWNMAVSNLRFWVFMAFELLVLYGTARAFLKVKAR